MLTKEQIQHIAHLARLKLSESEAAVFSDQLTKVLESFNEISQVPTEGVEPLITPTDMALFIREDQVVPHSGQSTPEELLQNAPSKSGHLYKVPPVV